MVKTIVTNYYCGWHILFLKHGKLINLTSSQWLDWYSYVYTDPSISPQFITFEASDRSRSQPLALIQILASELSLAPIREIAR